MHILCGTFRASGTHLAVRKTRTRTRLARRVKSMATAAVPGVSGGSAGAGGKGIYYPPPAPNRSAASKHITMRYFHANCAPVRVRMYKCAINRSVDLTVTVSLSHSGSSATTTTHTHKRCVQTPGPAAADVAPKRSGPHMPCNFPPHCACERGSDCRP